MKRSIRLYLVFGVLLATLRSLAVGQTTEPEAGKTPAPYAVSGRLIKYVAPTYPPGAKSAEVGGSVVVTATVAADGTMQNIKVVCGPPMLGDAAIAAISQWRYEPYRVEGVATPVSGSFYVNFTIGSEGLKHTGCEIPKLPPTLTPPPSRPPALPPAPEGILRISGRVMANSLDKKVDPVYPADSITVDARGTVLSLATIDKTGAVTDVQVISGPARFHEATVAAIKQWRYRPYEIDGKPVDVETTISLDFAPPR